MILVALTAAFWIPPLLGLGALLRYEGDPALRPGVSGFLGLGVLAVIGTCVGFFVPLGPTVSLAAWVLGLAAFVWRRRWLLEAASAWDAVAVATVLALLVLHLQPPMYDAGLYYLQSVRWATERGVEPGLANLHSRLGMNSAWHLVSAMVELPSAVQRSTWFVGLLPSAFGAAAAVAGLRKLLRGERSISSLLLLGTLLPMGAWVVGVGSQAPDHALAVLTFVVLALLARAFEAGADFAAEVRAAILLGALSVLVKLSGLPLLAGALAALLLRREAVSRGWLLRTGALLAAAFAPWVVRTVVLSGCLVMPAAATCLPGLAWAIPPAEVQDLSNWITSWARAPGRRPHEVLGSWGWIGPWAVRMRADPIVQASLALGGAGVVAWVAKLRETSAALVVPWAVALGGVAFWFFLAPDPRFAYGYLIGFGAVPLAFLASRARLASSLGARVVVAASVASLSVHLANASGAPLLALRARFDVPAWTWLPLPRVPMSERATASGPRSKSASSK